MKQSFLIYFDKKWCGNNQVPASLLSAISDNEKTPKTLAFFRLISAISLLVELFGYFFITIGLSNSEPVWICLFGIFLRIGGGLVGALFQNKAGIFLSLELQKYLKKLNTHSLEIRSFLADKGCSELEINSLQSLPSEIYQSELNSYQRTRIFNIGVPLFCGLALLINGDIIVSLLVIILGLISFPLGERFFKENTFRRESELRLGFAAQIIEYVDKVYKEHIWLTVKVNFLSQLPILLFAFRLIWNSSGQLLSIFFGLTQGLIGLTGTLAFQRARITAIRITEIASHLISSLSSSDLIVTPKRWKEHCLKTKQCQDNIFMNCENGIALVNFTSSIPFQRNKLLSISCIIASGAICLLNAPSGKGKSIFLSALTHLIEHSGDLFFITNNNVRNAHEFSYDEFSSKIFYFREENVDNSSRIVDLFKNINFPKLESFLKKAKLHFDSLLIDLAWKSPDNLLENEIKNIQSNKSSVFPGTMLDFLNTLRESQINELKPLFEKSKGNLSTNRIFPERNFATLSSGEKKRIVTLLALESCRTKKDIRLVILDEPLANLDPVNIDSQLNTLHALQELPVPPSLLIISHVSIQEIKEKLPRVTEIEL